MRTSPSVAGRAVLAIGLLVGFYVFALAIAGGLLAIPIMQYHYTERVTGQIALFAIMGAGAILLAIVPRRDRFEDPGPPLREQDHPRLFETLRRVAADTGQAMPVEVFLIPQLNAWVAQRGGVMGFGSRRVMGLGLPLMEALSVTQFRAVLAHEFGHYHGGDTRLGPWIYQTRGAIGRTLQGLQHQSVVLQKPFEWYGNLFLRITHAVSRRQEYSADALAARTVGAKPLITGLQIIHGGSSAFDSYWRDELVPALNHGLRPPLAAGFRRFLEAPRIRSAMDDAVRQELAEGQASPYDTHPALRERIAAIEPMPAGEAPASDPPALSLLEDSDRVEAGLLAFIGGPEAPALAPAAWEDLGTKVWLPFWRERAGAYAKGLEGLTPSDLPAHASNLSALAVRVGMAEPGQPVSEDHGRGAAWVTGVALAVVLSDRGWILSALPGEDVGLARGEERIRPFNLLHDLDTGALSPADWIAVCDRAGIATIDLGKAVAQSEGAAGARIPRPIWSFVAMEYYRLIFNRIYRVIVTEAMICGAKVRGTMSAPAFPGPTYDDPESYPDPDLQVRYAGIDPESPEFLAIDPANFQIPRLAIETVELVTRGKWGMGNIPHSGRLLLRERGGRRRDLVLVGEVDAAGIHQALAKES